MTGAASAATLLRVVNLLVQHDLALRSVAAEFGEEAMTMCIRLDPGAVRPAEALLDRLRALVEVSAVGWGQAPG